MQEKNSSGLGLMMISMAALFLAGFFLLVVFGAQSYRGTVSAREDNMNSRALLAYLATVVKANDRAGCITAGKDAEMGDILIIADGDSGYATCLYRYEGMLMEDYARMGEKPSPERSSPIAATDRFEILFEDGFIEVFTDAGRVLIHLRSGEE